MSSAFRSTAAMGQLDRVIGFRIAVSTDFVEADIPSSTSFRSVVYEVFIALIIMNVIQTVLFAISRL